MSNVGQSVGVTVGDLDIAVHDFVDVVGESRLGASVLDVGAWRDVEVDTVISEFKIDPVEVSQTY